MMRRCLAFVVAAAVQLASLGCLALGVWLCARHFPSVGLLPGVVLLALGALTLPRPPALPREATRLSRAEAPALHDLAGRVSAALGLTRPRVVAVDDRLDAASGFDGVLRRRYLRIGAPLWAVLDGHQRIALLAMELARNGTGDPDRAPVTGWVDRSLGELEALLEPQRDESLRALQDPTLVAAAPTRMGSQVTGTVSPVWVAELLLFPVVWVVRGVVGLLRRAYVALQRPAAVRALHAADAAGARLAGSAAVRDVLAIRALAPSIATVLRRDARAGDHAGADAAALRRGPVGPVVAGWPALVAQIRAAQPSLVDDDPAAYPPSLARRAALLADAAGVPALEVDTSATDGELEPIYRRVVRDLRTG
ncbi:M48 family metallopeptidase [Dactylosporangium sp. NPDC048998]|uniref:M48 family metallopeptidase n=1 Tax=Dactylosporangium sp. NPDC048998 TaxID=3363976 RepID=UPI00371272B7